MKICGQRNNIMRNNIVWEKKGVMELNGKLSETGQG